MTLTCRLPEETAILLKHYAEFLDSASEYVIGETLRLAFRRDKEFQAWLAATHPETRLTDREPVPGPADPPRPTDPRRPASGAVPARPDLRGERSGS